MNRPTSKLNQRQHEETVSQQQSTQETATVEFTTAEEMLRHDAAQAAVPPAVAERLQRSIANEPKPQPSWWQRLFKG